MSRDHQKDSGDQTAPSAETERGLERHEEEERFTSVIIKRWDEARRHPDDVLEHAIVAGMDQLQRRGLSLLLSAVAAGLTLGFSAMAVGLVYAVPHDLSDFDRRLLAALLYPVGFIICILSGNELFTEHTATAVYPVLDKRAPVTRLIRLWLLVWLGNLIGAAAIALLLAFGDSVITAADGYAIIAHGLATDSALGLLSGAILAGWLMALGAWLINATPPSINQTVAIYIVTFLIGFGKLHHSIAGSVELFAALFTGAELSALATVRFVLLASIGNLIGGSLMVAVLNYAHIRKSRQVGR